MVATESDTFLIVDVSVLMSSAVVEDGVLTGAFQVSPGSQKAKPSQSRAVEGKLSSGTMFEGVVNGSCMHKDLLCIINGIGI